MDAAAQVIGAEEGSGLDDTVDAAPGNGVLERPAAGRVCPRLGARVAGGRACHHPPVVEDLGDVHHPSRHLGGPEHHVEVLAPVELGTEPSDAPQEFVADGRDVPEVGVGEQQIGVPIGFELGLILAIHLVQLVLVRVDDIGVVLGRDHGGDPSQGIGREEIVVIDQHDELPYGGHQCPVGRPRDAAVLFEGQGLDPRVGGGELGHRRRQLGVARAVVTQAELPVPIGLIDDGLDALAEVPERRPVHRDDDAQQRAVDRQVLGGQGVGMVDAIEVPLVLPVPVVRGERCGVDPPLLLLVVLFGGPREQEGLGQPVGHPAQGVRHSVRPARFGIDHVKHDPGGILRRFRHN